MSNKPGIGGETFSLSFSSEFTLGIDFVLTSEPKYTADEDGGSWSYEIKPTSERMKRYLGLPEQKTEKPEFDFDLKSGSWSMPIKVPEVYRDYLDGRMLLSNDHLLKGEKATWMGRVYELTSDPLPYCDEEIGKCGFRYSVKEV